MRLNQPKRSDVDLEAARLLKEKHAPAVLYKYADFKSLVGKEDAEKLNQNVEGHPWTMVNLANKVIALRPPATFYDPFDSSLSFVSREAETQIPDEKRENVAFFSRRERSAHIWIHTGRASNAEKQPTGRGPEGCVENGPAAALLVRLRIDSDTRPPRALPAAHFDRNHITIICETAH